MSDTLNSKEVVYDNEIMPLMDKIIAICKEADIPFFANFDIAENDDGMRVGTLVPNKEGKVPQDYAFAASLMGMGE